MSCMHVHTGTMDMKIGLCLQRQTVEELLWACSPRYIWHAAHEEEMLPV